MNRRRVKAGTGRGFSPWKRIGLSAPGWILLLAVSCTGLSEKADFQEQNPDVQQGREVPSFRETEFRFAMTMLENGDFEGARETLFGMSETVGDQPVEPEVVFALGVIKLLDMESVERMRGCRDYFQSFADKYPNGPYQEHAERIVQILDGHIRRTNENQKRIGALTLEVSDQKKVIQTLQYQIEKLEEIHRETEEKRNLPDGD